MTTKLDFYQRKLSSQANELRAHLQSLADGSIGLNRRDKAEILDYLARLDMVQELFQTLLSNNGPDLRPQRIQFEIVQK